MNAYDLLRSATSAETQAEIGAKLGIRQPSVSLLLNGKRRPSVDLAARIERVYYIPASAWESSHEQTA